MFAPFPFAVELVAWTPSKPVENSNVLGHMDVLVPQLGLFLHEMVVKVRDGRLRAYLPSTHIIRDGEGVYEDGRRARRPSLKFADEAMHYPFINAALDALRAVHPEVVDEPTRLTDGPWYPPQFLQPNATQHEGFSR